MPFKKIGLCDELVQGILATGYTAPTEIQAEAIPVVIAGKDMIGCAQTGTGKTAAFVLPILNRIATSGKRPKKKKIRALIITPTRELAVQIDSAIKGYGRFTRVHSIAIYGGTPIDKQTKVLRRGVDIVVATPGRLLDHVQRGSINLSTVEVLVLDEADRMLDMGFIDDIKKIIKKIPKDRQTLLFSATVSKEISKLVENIQRSPKMIQIGREHNPIDTITQHVYPVGQDQKLELLLYMMERQQMYSVLIFSRTKRGADRICRKLKQNKIKAEAIHSDRTQRQRLRALDGFKRGQYKVMVATDIAARGLDVEGISHVFNYDIPSFPEDYVHRIGRTGRAEATGDAITFVADDEISKLRRIERFIGHKFKGEYYEDFEYKQHISLERGAGSVPGKRQRSGSSQRKRMKAKRAGSGGESKYKGGYEKRGEGKSKGGRKPAGLKQKRRSSAKPENANSKTGKKKTGSTQHSEAVKPTGSKKKKTFQRKAKLSRGSKPGGDSFKRSKRTKRKS